MSEWFIQYYRLLLIVKTLEGSENCMSDYIANQISKE